MNHLAFELVVSVVVFAVFLDLVSTPDAHVLVPVLVHLVSPVVLVLDEIAVFLDPFLIAVSMGSAHQDRLLQLSSASLAFLALRVMPYAAVPLHTC